ncbi:MAG: hypothetical protein M1538_00695 [Candidatus Marsarchaeota archaeon]|nr:hypothetical protein [Candidatus Marsarchaeota archaeon]
MKMNILLYIVIALAIVVAAYLVAIVLIPRSYSISVKSILLNNQSFYPFSTARFRVFVNNTGPNYIKNLSVVIYLNNKHLNSNSYSISLPPYKNATLNLNYTIPASVSGNLTFKAIADPAKLFNITNRSKTISTVSFFVNNVEAPNVYSSIPNNQIASTKSFSLNSQGAALALYLSKEYNLSNLDYFDLNADSNVIFSLFGSLINYLNIINGAYAKYDNGTAMYTIWMQGPINATTISSLLQKLNLNISTYNGIINTKLNSNTSLCTFYQKGWTKVLLVNNNIESNCTQSMHAYQSIENGIIINKLKTSNELISIQSRLTYANSTSIGSSIFMNNNSLALLNMSELNISKGNEGYFFGYVQKNDQTLVNTTNTIPCKGIVFNSTNSIICSIVMPQSSNPHVYNMTLINSTEIKGNYIITFYSLVNRTLAPNAQEGSASIIKDINVSGILQKFLSTIFKNSCNITSTNALACNIINAGRNSSVSFSIKNLNTQQIHLNSISCYIQGFEKNESINKTIAENQTSNITTQCLGGTVSFINPFMEYNLTVNYTLDNKSILANGIVDISST